MAKPTANKVVCGTLNSVVAKGRYFTVLQTQTAACSFISIFVWVGKLDAQRLTVTLFSN